MTRLDGCFIGTVAMPLPERIETLSLPVCGVMQSLPTVFLPGISHVIVPADMIGRDRAEETLRSWSHLLPGEAMGLLLLAEDQTSFAPLVYVKPTDSCVWERGCGSGSAAIGAWLTSVRGADQCVSLGQPGGVIQVVTRTEDGASLTGLTITGTVVIGQTKTDNIPL